MTTKPISAVLYARFSPRKDEDTSVSNEHQLAAARAYCARKGYAVASEHQDRALSGADAERPGLWAAMRALKRGSVLVVYRVDRLARDFILAEMLCREVGRKRAIVECVEGINGDGPEAIMTRQVLSAVAQFERTLIGKRTSAGMKHRQAQGQRMSRYPPYGWRLDPDSTGRLAPCPAEQATIERMRVLRAEGLTLTQIAEKLNVEGFPARSGRAWLTATLWRILQR